MSDKDSQLILALEAVVQSLELLHTQAAGKSDSCVCGKWPTDHDPIAPCARHAEARGAIQAAINTLDKAMTGLRKD